MAGRYRDALVELKAALELDPNSPDLLYNVARVYENLGLFDEAIEYYQRYQEQLAARNEEERDKTDKTIRRLQGAKLELEQLQRLEDEQEAERNRHPGRADLAFWATAAASAALLAGAGITGVLALKRNDDVAAFVVGPDGSLAKRDELVRQANGLALGTDIMLAGGAVAVTTAVLLYLLRDSEPEPAADDSADKSARTRDAKPALAAGFGPQGIQLRVDF